MTKLPMNLPNRITIARILLIPVYMLLLVVLPEGLHWIAAIVFIVAAVSDWLDGQIARRRNQITDFGKFMDPIADKLLVLAPMILFTNLGVLNVWAVILMVFREIIVSGFRLVAVGKGSVIAAGWTGKIKTAVQMLAVLLLTLGLFSIGNAIGCLAAALSVYSGAEIIYKNRAMLEETTV